MTNAYPPMKSIMKEGSSSASDDSSNSLASLFSSMCKPAYSARLAEIIKDKQATVFSTGYCPYCTKAKKLLDKNEVPYTEIMLDEISGVD